MYIASSIGVPFVMIGGDISLPSIAPQMQSCAVWVTLGRPSARLLLSGTTPSPINTVKGYHYMGQQLAMAFMDVFNVPKPQVSTGTGSSSNRGSRASSSTSKGSLSGSSALSRGSSSSSRNGPQLWKGQQVMLGGGEGRLRYAGAASGTCGAEAEEGMAAGPVGAPCCTSDNRMSWQTKGPLVPTSASGAAPATSAAASAGGMVNGIPGGRSCYYNPGSTASCTRNPDGSSTSCKASHISSSSCSSGRQLQQYNAAAGDGTTAALAYSSSSDAIGGQYTGSYRGSGSWASCQAPSAAFNTTRAHGAVGPLLGGPLLVSRCPGLSPSNVTPGAPTHEQKGGSSSRGSSGSSSAGLGDSTGLGMVDGTGHAAGAVGAQAGGGDGVYTRHVSSIAPELEDRPVAEWVPYTVQPLQVRKSQQQRMQQLVQEQEELWQQQLEQQGYMQHQQQTSRWRSLSPLTQFVATGLPAEEPVARISSKKAAATEGSQSAKGGTMQYGVSFNKAASNATANVVQGAVTANAGVLWEGETNCEAGNSKPAKGVKKAGMVTTSSCGGGGQGMAGKGGKKSSSVVLQHRTLRQQRQQQQMLQLLQEQQRRCHMHALAAKASSGGAAAAGAVRGNGSSSSTSSSTQKHQIVMANVDGICKPGEFFGAESKESLFSCTESGGYDQRGRWSEGGQVGLGSNSTRGVVEGYRISMRGGGNSSYGGSGGEATRRVSGKVEAAAGSLHHGGSVNGRTSSTRESEASDANSLDLSRGSWTGTDGRAQGCLDFQQQQRQQGGGIRRLPCVLRPPWQTTTPRATCPDQ